MSKCTAPIKGHKSQRTKAACPACGGHGKPVSYLRSVQTPTNQQAPLVRPEFSPAMQQVTGMKPKRWWEKLIHWVKRAVQKQ